LSEKDRSQYVISPPSGLSRGGRVTPAPPTQSTALEVSRTRDEALRRSALESVVRWATDQLVTSPRSVGAWLQLAQAQEALGLREKARQSYEQALKADATYELDPLRRLSDADRAAIEARVRVLADP